MGVSEHSKCMYVGGESFEKDVCVGVSFRLEMWGGESHKVCVWGCELYIYIYIYIIYVYVVKLLLIIGSLVGKRLRSNHISDWFIFFITRLTKENFRF